MVVSVFLSPILSIKLLLSNYKRLVNSEVFLTFITFLASFLTSGAALKIQGGSIIDVISESVIASVGTYFVRRSFRIFSRDNAGLSPDELVSVLIVINILLLGFNNAALYSVSLGGILSVLLILLSAKYGGIISGAVSGITTAFTMVLSGASGTVGVSFAVAGLFCGVFSSLGKYAQIFIFVICL